MATGTITANPSGYDATNSSYASIQSGYPITNGYTDSTSTTYCQINLTTGSRATTYFYYTFDLSGIPANATIDSVSCKAKTYISTTSTSYVGTRQVQMCTGTTTKGTATNVTTTATEATLSVGTWTREELQHAAVRLYAVRGTSSTSTSRYFRFYGATITVNYTYEDVHYTVTVNNSTSATVVASDSNPSAGEDVIISANTISGLTIKDNNVDVTSQFVQATGGTETQTAESLTTGFSTTGIGFYTSSSSSGHNFNYAIGHTAESPGSTSSGSGSWTYVKPSSGSTTGTGYADFEFDFSEIPAGATISSVQVRCYGAVEDSSQTTSHADITLYSGNTQKGTMQKFTSSTNSIITLSDVGTWTRDELQDAKLRFAVGYYGGHIFGITWTVTYAMSGYIYTIAAIATNHTIVVTGGGGPELYIKDNGQWKKVATAYKKVNGSWVMQSDLTSVFQSGVNYRKG